MSAISEVRAVNQTSHENVVTVLGAVYLKTKAAYRKLNTKTTTATTATTATRRRQRERQKSNRFRLAK